MNLLDILMQIFILKNNIKKQRAGHSTARCFMLKKLVFDAVVS